VIPSDHVIDECCIQGVGRFTAYLNGNIHIVFDDRTCLDMHGISWESHVYQKILDTLVSSSLTRRFVLGVRYFKFYSISVTTVQLLKILINLCNDSAIIPSPSQFL